MPHGDMKIRIAVIVMIVAVPSLINDGIVRMIAAMPCLGVALFLAVSLMRTHRESLVRARTDERERQCAAWNAEIEPLTAHLNKNTRITPELTSRLEEVARQTEQAALDICEGFMAIISRARRQAELASEVLTGPCAGTEALSAQPGTGEAVREVAARLDELKRENDALARDINGIIMSMQFQDITRQHIERVLVPLARLREDSEDLLRGLQRMNTTRRDRASGDRTTKPAAVSAPEPERAATKPRDTRWTELYGMRGGAHDAKEISGRG